MKKGLLLVVCCFFFAIGKSQYVAIPDSNFGKWLNSNGFATCLQGNSIVGWQLDTTCTLVTNATSVSCNNFHIKDLTGISYFDNLKSLTCAGLNSLAILPALPKHLTSLTCAIGQLVTLPPLPTGLIALDCSRNQLISLPTVPNSVTYLICADNNLAVLPDLPDSLSLCALNSNVGLQCLPKLKTIVDLYFGNTAITCIPNLGNVTNSYPSLSSFPICNTGNSNGCEVVSSLLQYKDEINMVSLFPNPSSFLVNINLDEAIFGAIITITDLTGRTVVETKLTTRNTQLSTVALPEGLYFVTLNTEGKTATQKLVISR